MIIITDTIHMDPLICNGQNLLELIEELQSLESQYVDSVQGLETHKETLQNDIDSITARLTGLDEGLLAGRDKLAEIDEKIANYRATKEKIEGSLNTLLTCIERDNQGAKYLSQYQ